MKLHEQYDARRRIKQKKRLLSFRSLRFRSLLLFVALQILDDKLPIGIFGLLQYGCFLFILHFIKNFHH
jgi:hypothetical protein